MRTHVTLKEIFESEHKQRSTIYRKIAQGLFPPQRCKGERPALWLKSEIEEWQRLKAVGVSDEQMRKAIKDMVSKRGQK